MSDLPREPMSDQMWDPAGEGPGEIQPEPAVDQTWNSPLGQMWDPPPDAAAGQMWEPPRDPVWYGPPHGGADPADPPDGGALTTAPLAPASPAPAPPASPVPVPPVPGQSAPPGVPLGWPATPPPPAPGAQQFGWQPSAPWGQGPPRRKKFWLRATVAATAAAVCLAVAVTAGTALHTELTRKPTAAELSRAAAAAVSRRWQAWPAGKIFPSAVPYTTTLQVLERAQRVGIDPGTGCAGGVDSAVAAVLRRYGCRALLRASYLDQREAVVFTIGVVAFPSAKDAAAARSQLHATPVSGLRAYAIPRTASALFSDQARQAATVAGGGPYVVLTTSGFSDGRPASATGERRPTVFAPASQLGDTVLSRLDAPAVPRCGAPGWAC